MVKARSVGEVRNAQAGQVVYVDLDTGDMFVEALEDKVEWTRTAIAILTLEAFFWGKFVQFHQVLISIVRIEGGRLDRTQPNWS
ncbi:hypothetical protein RMR10_022860 [Agrobacterium rosae]|uniref:hypothetical protein n=1 Tax=Agrobacterium rosae TaxID=1972867 RepID=UPI002A16213B|nr:hypothetical protein [Agrobacterium rosae]MDX8315182.1 hypothetical protein [Agrobacterium rosae]